ncbi:MAG: phage major capsid protein [Pirellulaceae bacterium]|nr:phage major capsid protein [Pirellulaceae bacterium]
MPAVLTDRRLKQLERRVRDADESIETIHKVAAAQHRALTDAEQQQLAGWVDLKEACESDVRLYRQRLEHEAGQPPIWSEERDLPGNRHCPPRPVDTSGMGKGEAWAAKLFGIRPQVSSDFSDLHDLVRQYRAGVHSEAMAQVMTNSMGEASGASGGFAVPSEFRAEYWGSLYERGVIWPLCYPIEMSAETTVIPAWDDSTSAAGSMFGGLVSSITAEGATINESSAKMRAVKLQAKKFATYVETSNELEADASRAIWPSMLIDALQTVQSFELDRAVLRGDGATAPLGLLNSPSTITQDKENAQAAGSLVVANLAKMFSRLHPMFYRGSTWMVSPSVIPWLEQLTISAGTGGGPWAGLVRLSASGEYSIMGRPVVVSEHCSAVGTTGDVILADLNQYLLGMRQVVTIESSRHVAFKSDEVGWRSILRVDGLPKYSSVYTPRTGSTMSWAVALQTR